MPASPPVHAFHGAFDELENSKPVPLMLRTGCAWPVHDHPTLFCNLPKHGTSSFCPVHFRMAYPSSKYYLGK